VGGVLGRLDGDLAEAVLFHLMPSFCTHRIPSSLNGRMAIAQFNRVISTASKRSLSRNQSLTVFKSKPEL